MNILITGAGGQLGQDLIRVLSGKHQLIAKARTDLDITDESAVRRTVAVSRPDAIIHAAAYTRVDSAESQIEEAYTVNAFGARNVALAAKEAGAKLVYISTDYVFDGYKGTAYNEQDRTNPLSVYGQSKLLGEKFVQLICDRFYIVRTSWLYGKHGSNFVTKVLALAEKPDQISMVNDQFGSPTYTYDLARFIGEAVEKNRYGIYHASNRGCCSRHEFAQRIMKFRGFDADTLVPVASNQFPLPAARPDRSDLDDAAIRANGFTRMRPWEDALCSFLLQDLQLTVADESIPKSIEGGAVHGGN